VCGHPVLPPGPLITHIHRVLISGARGAALIDLSGDLMDGLVTGVDRVVDGVVLRALDEHPLVLRPRAFLGEVAVSDAGVTPDGAEASVD